MSIGDADAMGDGESSDGAGFSTRFEGYSDYEVISLRTARAIDNALEAYSRIDGAHAENANISPEFAAEARARILATAIKLVPELEHDREDVELYDEILERWTGEDGYVARLDEIRLQNECPGWLFDFVLDARRAGWELGYLQAGRTTKEYDDPVEEEVEQMFEGLQ